MVTLTSLQRTGIEIAVGAVVLLGGYGIWRAHIRADAVNDLRTKYVQDSIKVEQDTAKARAQAALQAASDAQTAKDRALAQVTAGAKLQRRTDSLSKVASNERDAATRLLADSLATVRQLRGQLGSLVERSRADSAAQATQHAADAGSIRALLSTLASDSTALTASQKEVASLKALAASLASEVKLIRAAQPSKVGPFLKFAVTVALAVEGGRLSAGKFP
jgi:hypothetical protein